jgi:hypothetical protein
MANVLRQQDFSLLSPQSYTHEFFYLFHFQPKKKLGIKTGKPICCCCPDTKKVSRRCEFELGAIPFGIMNMKYWKKSLRFFYSTLVSHSLCHF